eukprot:6203682-Pleurochrysis_carterae.AAC.2
MRCSRSSVARRRGQWRRRASASRRAGSRRCSRHRPWRWCTRGAPGRQSPRRAGPCRTTAAASARLTWAQSMTRCTPRGRTSHQQNCHVGQHLWRCRHCCNV